MCLIILSVSLSYVSCNRQNVLGGLSGSCGLWIADTVWGCRDIDFPAQRSHKAFLITGGMQYQIFSDGRVAWHRPAPWSDGTLARTHTTSETVNSHKSHEKKVLGISSKHCDKKILTWWWPDKLSRLASAITKSFCCLWFCDLSFSNMWDSNIFTFLGLKLLGKLCTIVLKS